MSRLIRPAVAEDLDAIMRIELLCFPTDAWSRQNMAAELASPHGQYFVFEEAGALIGYAGLRSMRGAPDADVQTIALLPEHRGNGRGRALLHALLDEARARGSREVFLDVRADNTPAETLYRSEGFTQIGRRPRYYQPEDVDALVLRLSLSEWVRARQGAGAERPGSASEPIEPTGSAGPVSAPRMGRHHE